MVFSMTARVLAFALMGFLLAAPARAQERRGVVFGTVGGAGLGHADSEMGKAPIFGGGVGFHLTPRLLAEADVETGSVSTVFGGVRHDFRQTMLTGSLVFRSSPSARAHFIGGGGIGIQWAHTDVNEPPFLIDRTETIRHLHGRAGIEWDLSSRAAIRTEGVMWFGPGLDWVVGGRAGVSYRF
jgi:hypothetical protein